MTRTAQRFVIAKHAIIGASAAEQDTEFLSRCFVDMGVLKILRDCSDPRCIILGRTGIGKTALINRLQDIEQNAIAVSPEMLSLKYIANSNVIKFLTDLGVKLDLFYRLLWRHVFTVEIIKARHRIYTEEAKSSWLAHMMGRWKTDQKKKQQLEYLLAYGEKFWEETEYRVKEITSKFENQVADELKATLGPSAGVGLGFTANHVDKLSEEVKTEVIERAKKVVNRFQIQDLSNVFTILSDDVLDNPQQHFYIVIDRLDENWAEEDIRYRLIRALLETMRDFSAVRNAKIIAALRSDLLDRVFRRTRDAGFQEEKYESLYLRVRWEQTDLAEMIDLRLAALSQQQGPSKPVTHTDLLPKTIRQQPSVEYILARTFLRPRDVILFFNQCIERSVGLTKMTASVIQEAEGEYSRKLLRALASEWFGDLPTLQEFVQLLRTRPPTFRLHELPDDDVEYVCLKVLVESERTYQHDPVFAAAQRLVNEKTVDAAYFRRVFCHQLYRTGLVGLKLEAYSSFFWSVDQKRSVSESEITDKTQVSIHPGFWRALGIAAYAGSGSHE